MLVFAMQKKHYDKRVFELLVMNLVQKKLQNTKKNWFKVSKCISLLKEQKVNSIAVSFCLLQVADFEKAQLRAS